jgi:predicted helicase
LSVENTERIKEQNSERKISVIIGNPPYNAKQEDYSQQNANRPYKEIDARIKNTYIKYGTAQNKNQVYDMYLRFFRWASDRISDNGIIAFITNRSYLDATAFDGVRLAMQKEFNYIYCIDLGGDITNKQDKSLLTGNVFGIKTGVAIIFLIKKENTDLSKLFYYKLSDDFDKAEKLTKISSLKIESVEFEKINPDEKNKWLNQTDNDFDSLLPLLDKNIKAGKGEQAIFRLFSRGIATQRDEWVYDFDKDKLENKMRFFVEIYQATLRNANFEDKHLIKWDAELGIVNLR